MNHRQDFLTMLAIELNLQKNKRKRINSYANRKLRNEARNVERQEVNVKWD